MITYKGVKGWCELTYKNGYWTISRCVAPMEFCSGCIVRFRCWTIQMDHGNGGFVNRVTLTEAMDAARYYYGDRLDGV